MNRSEEKDVKKVCDKPIGRSYQHSDLSEDISDSSLEITSALNAGVSRPPTLGWVEAKYSVNRTAKKLLDEEHLKEKEVQIDSDEDIPVIPDIEELQDDISSPHKVKQPTIFIDRSTYKELDEELSKSSISSSLQTILKQDSINLSLLTKKMLAEKDIKEVSDEEWTMEALYNELVLNPRKL